MMVFPAITDSLGAHAPSEADDADLDSQSLCFAQDLCELMQAHTSLNHRYQNLLQRLEQAGITGDIAEPSDQVKLNWIALHDSMTGLANRWMLGEQMDALLRVVQPGGQQFALLHIGVDRLDSFSISERHVVLREVASRLQRALRHSDLLARVGKGTFAVILRGVHRQTDVRQVADKLLGAVSGVCFTGISNRRITCSLGCARYPTDGVESHVLSRHADLALQAAAQEGGGCCHFHERATGLTKSFSLGLALWGAADRGELRVVYQPQWKAGQQVSLRGYSASLRWHHTVQGEVLPDEFIPAAVRNGAIHLLGDWMLKQVLGQLSGWQACGIEGLQLTVSLMPVQLEAPDFVDRLLGWTTLAGVEPSCLELDVTDPLPGQAVPSPAMLDRLRHKGFRVSQSCGRQAFASLTCAQPMPLDCIRLDRQLVQALPVSEQARALCRCYVDLGHSLGLDVVAEGVDTDAQWAILRGMGCQQVQGALTGLPCVEPDPVRERAGVQQLRLVSAGPCV